jgi:hypothetical protein
MGLRMIYISAIGMCPDDAWERIGCCSRSKSSSTSTMATQRPFKSLLCFHQTVAFTIQDPSPPSMHHDCTFRFEEVQSVLESCNVLHRTQQPGPLTLIYPSPCSVTNPIRGLSLHVGYRTLGANSRHLTHGV